MNTRLMTLAAVVAVAFGSTAALATMVVSADYEPLARRAELIVRGVVRGSTVERSGDGLRFRTVTRIEVLETVKGAAPKFVEVSTRGGTMSGLGQTVIGEATFAPDEEVVLLLGARPEPRARFAVVGMGLGKFRIERHPTLGRVVTQDRSGITVVEPGRPVVHAPDFEPTPVSAFMERLRRLSERSESP